MSEENRWGQDPQGTDRNVPTEENALNTYGNADTGSAEEKNTDNNIDNRPLTHPYSAGRRMQESQRNSAGSSDTAGNGTAETAAGTGNSYVIKPGDTLYQISITKYGTMEKVAEICQANGLTEDEIIYPGQIIVLP